LNGVSRVIQNVYEDHRFNSSIDQKLNFVSRNILAVPVKFGNFTIGVIEAINKKFGDFSNMDFRLMKTMTYYLATALSSNKTSSLLTEQKLLTMKSSMYKN
jgi:GAF domain-containing protein